MIITDLTQLVTYLENNIDNLEQVGELIDGDVCLYTSLGSSISVEYYMVQVPVKLWKEYENNDRQYPFMSMACEFDIIGLNWFAGGEENPKDVSWTC